MVSMLYPAIIWPSSSPDRRPPSRNSALPAIAAPATDQSLLCRMCAAYGRVRPVRDMTIGEIGASTGVPSTQSVPPRLLPQRFVMLHSALGQEDGCEDA